MFRSALFYSNEIQQYAVPFMGSDPSVVKRTQRFLSEEQQTPVSYFYTHATLVLMISGVIDINKDITFICV